MPPAAPPASLRSPSIYALVLAATLGTIALSLWSTVVLHSSAFVILMVVVTLTGIPHGAVDHLVASELYGLDMTWRDQLKFYGFYLILMAIYGALWMVAPVPCLVFFLLMTVYHFGQADLAYLALPPVSGRWAYCSRGLLLMGLPITAHPADVAPIFEAIAGFDLMQLGFVVGNQGALVAFFIAQHALTLAFVAARYTGFTADLWREGFNLAVLSVLFVLVHPLVAFAVYFGLWHSLGHILELIRFFNQRGETTSLRHFYRQAALFTILSFVMLGALYAVTQSLGAEDQMIALLFILISVMTLPHMIIVERLYQEQVAETART